MSAEDGPERPEETAKATNTNPRVLRNDPQKPQTKYIMLNPTLQNTTIEIKA